MKGKFLLACLLMMAAATTNAQIKKGSTLLGGSLNFQTGKSEWTDYKQTSFWISPVFGKAIRDNLVSGVELQFGSIESKDTGNFVVNDKSYGAGYFLRKYAVLGNNFYLFGEGKISGGYHKRKSDYVNSGSQRSEGYNVGLQFYPGVAYAISNKFHLEVGLPNLLQMSYSKSLILNKASSFSFRTALSDATALSIGFRVLLNTGTSER